MSLLSLCRGVWPNNETPFITLRTTPVQSYLWGWLALNVFWVLRRPPPFPPKSSTLTDLSIVV